MIEKPCMHCCIDAYLSAFQPGLWERKAVVKSEWRHIIRGFHAAGAAVARAGNLVIIDDVLETEPPWVASLQELFAGIPVIFVGVHCPLEELERREHVRNDRKTGLARFQFAQVHAQALYDIEVNTSVLQSNECARMILEWMRAKHSSSAWKRLAEKQRSV